MSSNALAWFLFVVYLVATTILALRGMKQTKSFSSFALGNGDLGPVLTGITLAAAIASTATFVINPGFVYKDGLAAFLHFGVAGYGGVILGLVTLSAGFRKLGMKHRALTLPHWMEARYGSSALRTYFALFNLLVAIAFVVLIVKGSTLVMQATLGLDYVPALVLIVTFVFSYILLGGTYAHVYTNALQGSLMVVVAAVIFVSGLHHFSGGVSGMFEELAAIDPNLARPINPDSTLFSSALSVFVGGFVVSIGLVAQPHVLTKAMYLRSDRDLVPYLGVGVAVCIVYGLVLFAGFYARLELGEGIPQDAVIPSYLAKGFPAWVGAPVAVALLAAGMSTLDGILVSASTIAANDVFLGALGDRLLGDKTEEERQNLALKASRWILIGMGLASFAIAYDPPKLVGVFGQWGIYGLVTATFVPIVAGVVWPRFGARAAFASAIVGPIVHFGYYGYVTLGLGQPLNPAVSATFGIVAAAVAGLLAQQPWATAKAPASAEPAR